MVKGKIPVSAKHDDIGTTGEYWKQLSSHSHHYTSREEDRSWLKDIWYGEVFSVQDILGLECKIEESGVSDCSLRYLGGKGVLLSSNGSRKINENIAENVSKFNQWCLEFTRILLHTSCMSSINSKLEIRVDGEVVPIWVVEDVSLFDSYEVLSGIIGRHSMFSTFSNYVADSLSGQKSIVDRAPVTTAVENNPTVVLQREEDMVVNLSVPLQSGIRVADEEVGMGFSREICELGDGCINGDKQGVSNSLLVIPDSGST
ncbi:hypothetical protein Ancab_000533 [Ancistrocladus abbreviatus]